LSKYNIDINAVLIKPIYIGLLINAFIPVVIVGIAYFLEEGGGITQTISNENLELIFYILVGLALVDGGLAIYWKQKLFFAPLIRSKETFEDDFTKGFFAKSIVCYAIIAAIAIYGLVIYLLGGTFNQLLFLVLISFIAFQFIRPRAKFTEKVLAAQEQLAEQGQFLSDEK